ncbi:MAG: MerR family transcriptional regulator [Candidatus Acidiferrales bacterium]
MDLNWETSGEGRAEGNGHPASAIPGKNLFRIGEVSRLTSTKPFVLRFWETEFPMLQPVKSPKGHRLYRRQDIETVLVIKRLLYDEGFTIAGARRHLRDQTGEPDRAPDAAVRGGSRVEEAMQLPVQQPPQTQIPAKDRQALLDLRDSLRSLLTALESE